MSAVLGYILGMSLALFVIYGLASKSATLTILMTPKLAAYLFALTVGMCVFAAITAIFKVTRIDPGGRFQPLTTEETKLQGPECVIVLRASAILRAQPDLWDMPERCGRR